MIVFQGDNGYSWGSHRWEPKQCPYEECMRVPLIIRYAPLAPLPRTETGFGLNIDHGQTIAELAGATPDPGVEGMSLVRLLDGTAPSWRTDFRKSTGTRRRATRPTSARFRPTPRCAASSGSTTSTSPTRKSSTTRTRTRSSSRTR
jgi:arylsulfatase A-like enzyme